MAWTNVSAVVLAVLSVAMVSYLIKNGRKKELWLPLVYFALMGLLQWITFFFINQCISPLNRTLTFIAYTHIAFQPLFINMFALNFISEEIKKKITPYVYGLCWVGAACYYFKAYPFSNTYLCVVGQEAFCGRWACAFKGEWYLAWQWPLNTWGSASPWIDVPPKEYVAGIAARAYMLKGNWEFVWQFLRDFFGTQPLWMLSGHKYILGLHAQAYILSAFCLPLIYGSWRVIGLLFIFGPLLASFSTHHMNEFVAVWNLYGLGLLLILTVPAFYPYLFVKKWIFNKPIMRLVNH